MAKDNCPACTINLTCTRKNDPALDCSPAYIFPVCAPTVPTEATVRKGLPVYSGVLMYFPDAILAIAELSRIGNDQHNPGQPLHWAKEKSKDHHDCILRHILDAGNLDSDGVRHSAKVAWRALAALQIEIEAEIDKAAE